MNSIHCNSFVLFFFCFPIAELLRKKRRAIVENNIQQLATVCKNLGDYYHENQQYENALDAYSEEATFYERLGKDMEKARAHRMVGEMYMLLENFDDAMKHEKIYLGLCANWLILVRTRYENRVLCHITTTYMIYCFSFLFFFCKFPQRPLYERRTKSRSNELMQQLDECI